MEKQNILLICLFLIVQIGERVAEWIEIPQFSDDEKVYRVPGFNKFDINQKLYVVNTEAPIHGFPNVTTIIHGINKLNINKGPEMSQSWNVKPMETSTSGMELNKIHVNKYQESSQSWIVKPTVSGLNGIDSPQIIVTEETIYLPGNNPLSTIPTPLNIENFSDDHYVTVKEENIEDETTVTTIENVEEISIDDDYQTTTSDKPISEESLESDEDNDSNRSFLYFIPVELFRKVHRTLKSQPATLKGKMHFLKNFEKALLAEIQKRLVPVVAPVRKRRESRGDHSWDEHDDGVGFPSLEGALMAISFLTFAVYLVQLVMMLFRNLGTQPTTATGTATVLFNRNKRSHDDLNERTARIYEYLDKYANTRSIDD